MNSQIWHQIDSLQVLEELETNEFGLSQSEANMRLARYGTNELPARRKKSPLKRFIQQFHNLLIYILLSAGVVTSILGHWIDSGVILGVVLINGIIGFIQEGKAERALDAISEMLSQQANVIRDGQQQNIITQKLVPGDIIYLQSGDKVPADLRLFKARELHIDEAMLTGESIPSEKNTSSCDKDTPLGDRDGMAYSGTLVTSGTATGVVVATAKYTEIGQISQLLEQVSVLETPLLRKISQFGRWLTMVILIITSLTFVLGLLFRGYTATEMFLAAVGLAVAAVPEGLPAIITITLAIGVQAMARRHAIIRRLPAVETLGSVTTICTDKTGTLTCNEMTVQSIALTDNIFQVKGVGYVPLGELALNTQPVIIDQYPHLRELCLASLLCNDSCVCLDSGRWNLVGDPTEGALYTLALKAGLDDQLENRINPRIDSIPFESEHRFMATLHHDHESNYFIFIKGAPEEILKICDKQRADETDTSIDLPYWETQMNQMASQGQRLLAIAIKPVQTKQALSFSDTKDGFTLMGLVGMIDPPRVEAKSAISACHNAGIQVKMITGDHATTAGAIGHQLGIRDSDVVLTGNQIDQMNDKELLESVNKTHIFARTSPQHKLRLVSNLQSTGQIVAMTGDGVNDAPALKRADVGVAMGLKGTSVARETAEMVLIDDNFASIVNAIEEGRTVYDNIKKSILFILPTNGGEALTILAAILFGRVLPITPVQILWVNMITAVTLALALAFEPAEKQVMKRLPRAPDEPLITSFLIWRIVFVSLILVCGTFGLFILERDSGASIEYSRTVAVNMLVTFEIFYLFNSRYIYEHAFKTEVITGNRYAVYAVLILIIFQAMFTYSDSLQLLFGTEAISFDSWLNIICVGSSVFFLVEIEKVFMRRIQKNKQLNGEDGTNSVPPS